MQPESKGKAYLLTKSCVFVFLSFAGLYPTAASATPACTTGSFATYVALDVSGGCTIGNYTFLRFTDPTPTIVGSPTVASASEILVTPIQTAGGAGFSFSAAQGTTNLFSISSSSGTASVTYYLNYTIDPPPVIGDAELSIDPPYGNVVVTQTYCTADVLANDCVLGTQVSQSVTPAAPLAFISFGNPSTLVDVDTDVSLTASPGNPAGLDAVNAYVNVPQPIITATPEPSVLWLTACPLFVLFLARRKRA